MHAIKDPSFFSALIKDGRPLLSLTALALILSGAFAIFLGVTGQFLPHDVAFLGMTPEELCRVNECRIVHFMIHDRIAFGGALIALGTLYLWLVEFPLRQGKRWAWRLFLFSGLAGFASFLAYLGYGYLDTWHGWATLALLPIFGLGMVLTSRIVHEEGTRDDLARTHHPCWGRRLLLFTGIGLAMAGLVILVVGMTCVFVPQDLTFMALTVEDLHAINPRLVPLIAHDRAGFGGAVLVLGCVLWGCVFFGEASTHRWQAIAIAGVIAFGTAIGVHPAVGYNDWVHLAPAMAGATVFVAGLWLSRPRSAGNVGLVATREIA